MALKKKLHISYKKNQYASRSRWILSLKWPETAWAARAAKQVTSSWLFSQLGPVIGANPAKNWMNNWLSLEKQRMVLDKTWSSNMTEFTLHSRTARHLSNGLSTQL